ncbi:TolC family protein [Sphingomonas sp. CARO-RG-8B-R24-01]|uniref:TolC family protein n=1 Tax=Sphingomonas sp. CARO-RG-8B-R24-01 TaxID=2914831 RepID=UPI001F55C64F|nr:TolC family protein [Sphingomonas sp. CARO-RG-8B-R24-01]
MKRGCHYWHIGVAAFLLTSLVIVSGAGATTPDPILLPPPSGAPLDIDFTKDPLLRFAHTAAPERPFLQALGTAVEHHPSVESAIADQQATKAVRTQVRSGLFPKLDTQLLYNRVLSRDFAGRTAIVESLQPRIRTDLTVTGDQLLFDFGATGNRIAAANDRIKAASAEVERVAAETALRAIAAWYDVLAYQSLCDLSSAMVTRQTEILADVRLRAAQGVGPISDIARAEAMLADAQAQGTRFDRQLAQSRNRYREVFQDEPPNRLDRPLPSSSLARSRDAAEALASKSPSVQVARHRAEAARRDYRAVRDDRLPRLSAGVNGARYDVFTSSDYEVRGTIVLRQSLFAGGHQRGLIDQASAQARSADFIADRVEGEADRDAGVAFTDLEALGRTSARLEAAYIANRRVRDAYAEQFRVSRGTLIELLRAEQDYFVAATSYLQATIDVDVARYTLLTRTGEILPLAGLQFVSNESSGSR